VSDERPAFRRYLWPTVALWAVGIGLQFAAPLLRDNVPLSDGLFITSMFAPVWTFLQLCVLAGLLVLVRKASTAWTPSRRTAFGVAAALFCLLLQPTVFAQVLAPGEVPLSDPVEFAVLWSTALAFYVLPAAIVVRAWLRQAQRVPTLVVLGLALVIIGVLNFPYILWLTHLWKVYIEPTGGGQVLRLFGAMASCAFPTNIRLLPL
jgi:hypothetical protein